MGNDDVDGLGGSGGEDVVDGNLVVCDCVSSVVGSSEADCDVLADILGALVGEVDHRGGDVDQRGGVGVHLHRRVDRRVVLPLCCVAVGEDEVLAVSAEFSDAVGRVGGHVGGVPVLAATVAGTHPVEPLGYQGQRGVGPVTGVAVRVLAFRSVSVGIVEGGVASAAH